MSLRSTLLATVLVVVGAASAHATSFALPANGSVPFSTTSGGITASFSSTAGNGVFTVGSTNGLFTFASGLGDFGSFNGDPLTITFSQAITQPISFAFGLEDAFGLFGSDTLTVTGSNGQVRTFGTTPNSLTLAEPQGTVNFTPTSAVTSITLTSANPYAISNINVPEPISISLLGVGLAGLAATRRRQRQAAI